MSTLVFIILLCLGSLLCADTTWVSGDVYGVWDTIGSPVMVTDTITVPLDSTLEIRPGVEVWFQNQEVRRTPFIVHGRLLAVGEEGDSIYFYSPEAGFGGIYNQQTPGTEIRLEYCVVDSSYLSISSRYGSIVAKHSRIFLSLPSFRAIFCVDEVDTVQYCVDNCSGTLMTSGGPGVFQHNQGGGITASFQQMEPIFDNNVWGVSLSYCSWTEVYDNEILTAGSQYTDVYWHDNTINNRLYFTAGTHTVERNVFPQNVSGFFRIRANECQATIRENQIHGFFSTNAALIDFEKNLVISSGSGLQINGAGDNVIQGNTIVFGGKGIESYVPSSAQIEIINNIFMGDGVNCTGVYSTWGNPIAIQYNDFYQVNSVTYQCELDTGNIFLDPRFRAGNPYDYQLQANSPCIDAGDPSSPLDPDCTRTDMGCYYFDQLIDQPPAIVSPVTVNVQRGQILRYEARATDDHGPLRLGFWDVPGWLHRVYPQIDYEEGIAVLSGRVPHQQQDFTFGIWVEDGLAQRDSQEVEVLISSYTILAGELTGVLNRDQSPYLVVEDVIVPAGDSLVIEPGVEFRFQWEPIEDLRHRIVVYGKLNAIGTPQDTIYFLPEFGDSLTNAWRGIWCLNPADTTYIGYAYLLNARYGMWIDSGAVAQVVHSWFQNPCYGVNVSHESWIGIDSCDFRDSYSDYGSFIYVNSSSATVTNSYFEYPDTTPYSGFFNFIYDATGLITGCTFVGEGGGGFDMSSRGDIIGNLIWLDNGALGYTNGSSGVFANNICNIPLGLLLAAADSILVTNNLFYRQIEGIYLDYQLPEVYIENNIFLANQIGIHMHNGNPFDRISYNDFFENDTDYVNCIVDSTNIFVDPIMQDTIDFRLSLGSPCIDAGDPDPFFNDPDSTRNDIGCWGGPWGESYPYSPALTQLYKPIPTEFALLPPYPNPFNSVLVIPFTIPTQSEVKITIYNILGQRVDQFDFSPVSPGAHRVLWDANAMSSGLYIVEFSADGKEFRRKVVLLK